MVPKKKFLNNNEFSFGPWNIKTVKGAIMNSEEIERYVFRPRQAYMR